MEEARNHFIYTATWADRWKGAEVRSRVCVWDLKVWAKQLEGLYTATPSDMAVAVVEAWALRKGKLLQRGDVSAAFVHVPQPEDKP
eukprot:13575150-Alexandrium_andersonii.AAC.1